MTLFLRVPDFDVSKCLAVYFNRKTQQIRFVYQINDHKLINYSDFVDLDIVFGNRFTLDKQISLHHCIYAKIVKFFNRIYKTFYFLQKCIHIIFLYVTF